MVDDEKWPFPWNPAAYFYPKAVHDVIGRYNLEEHQCMNLDFILAVVQVIEPLYVDVVLRTPAKYRGQRPSILSKTCTHYVFQSTDSRRGMEARRRSKPRCASPPYGFRTGHIG